MIHCMMKGDFIMPKPYDYDLRIRVAREASRGVPIRTVALQYNVSPSFVHRMRHLYQDTGDVQHRQFGGYRRFTLLPYREALIGEIERRPSATLKELKHWLLQRYGVKTAISTLDLFLRKGLGLSYKKNGTRIRTGS